MSAENANALVIVFDILNFDLPLAMHIVLMLLNKIEYYLYKWKRQKNY